MKVNGKCYRIISKIERINYNRQKLVKMVGYKAKTIVTNYADKKENE